MLIERSERAAENGGKSGTDAKNGRDGEGEKVHVCAGERELGKISRGRGRENEREYSFLEWGLCEGYEEWCKGDGEAGGSASNEESQRLTKKKGRTLQFIDRPAVRAATRGVK